jgi:hypothetical protein
MTRLIESQLQRMILRKEQGSRATFINDWLVTGAGIGKPSAWNFCGAANPEPELTDGTGTVR